MHESRSELTVEAPTDGDITAAVAIFKNASENFIDILRLLCEEASNDVVDVHQRRWLLS